MARNKSSKTPHYELLYVVSNKYTEDELKKVIENVEKTITKYKGEITYREEWGKKKLAYTINHFSHGYYQLAEFDMEGESMAKLNNELRLSDEVLRHMIVAKPKMTEEEIKKQKEKEEKNYLIITGKLDQDKKEKSSSAATESKTEKKSDDSKTKKEEGKKSSDKEPVTPLTKEELKKEEKKKKDVDLKDLDEKLDNILDTDDLL